MIDMQNISPPYFSDQPTICLLTGKKEAEQPIPENLKCAICLSLCERPVTASDQSISFSFPMIYQRRLTSK